MTNTHSLLTAVQGAINVVPWGGAEKNTLDVVNTTLTNNSVIAGK
jgi:hypothetical protein